MDSRDSGDSRDRTVETVGPVGTVEAEGAVETEDYNGSKHRDLLDTARSCVNKVLGIQRRKVQVFGLAFGLRPGQAPDHTKIS